MTFEQLLWRCCIAISVIVSSCTSSTKRLRGRRGVNWLRSITAHTTGRQRFLFLPAVGEACELIDNHCGCVSDGFRLKVSPLSSQSGVTDMSFDDSDASRVKAGALRLTAGGRLLPSDLLHTFQQAPRCCPEDIQSFTGLRRGKKVQSPNFPNHSISPHTLTSSPWRVAGKAGG